LTFRAEKSSLSLFCEALSFISRAKQCQNLRLESNAKRRSRRRSQNMAFMAALFADNIKKAKAAPKVASPSMNLFFSFP
jgi:hypothetical protein